MLSDRRQRVLAALIEEYVARALPVGSRTLTERYHLGVSPATVRNELSVLEDGGYITQPHTSAGRIPTDHGYRAFVDNLLETDLMADDARYRPVVDELRQSASELDALLEQTSSALMRLTDCLSIVLAPSVLNLHIKQLSLISLIPTRALVVLVTEDGQVFNRQMEFGEEVSSEDLARVQHFLSDVFAGKTLHEIEDGLGQGMIEAFRDPLVRMVLDEVLSCLQESELSRAHRLGVSSLLTKPEFSQSQALLPVMQVLEDETVLLHILDDAAAESGPTVRIGRENEAAQLAGVSVVANRYGRGESAGVVAVIGPTRMDYSKVIRAVRIASAALEDV
ncbi:heat-inducible transcriptional repressor HrcA [Eggerthella sp. YY7918]|uniref:heat-inducible transcriptional repressor HrcA n=1 Tax=Eggerthella sp. (strain YY7918) TaxID=502558 RepID=UPI00021718AA|nr:heat-inducible transcriptional repressor HrcA [Eggerthella sp. YY7918]BAK44588.1 transcriptional regulator of heat shock gene [Eggerthella sp. YY7918]